MKLSYETNVSSSPVTLKRGVVKMGILLLLINQAVYQGYGAVTRHYSRKHGNGGLFFNAIICLFSMIFFIITDKDGLNFTKELFIYGSVSVLLFVAGFYYGFVKMVVGLFKKS